MHTQSTGDPPRGGPIITTLLEVAAKMPAILLHRLLATRIQMQSLHQSPCPIVMMIQKDDAKGNAASLLPLEDPWIPEDDIVHGFLTEDSGDLKVVFPNFRGTMAVTSVSNMSDFCCAHPAVLTAAQWDNLDLHATVDRGRPVVMIFDQGPIPREWVNAIDEVISSFRLEGLRGFEATYVGLDDAITPAGFHEEFDGFPDTFVEAMLALASEVDNLVGHLAPHAGNSREEREFENCDEISKACIGALVPGIRALKLQGVGWPALTPEQAKAFLNNLRQAQPVAVDTIWSFQIDLDPRQREELLSFLLKAGVISMEGSLVSAVEPAEFFANQVGCLALNEEACLIQHLA